MRFNRLLAFAAVLAAISPSQALAWGATGHRIIGRLAVQALPSEVPAFLRTPQSAEAIGELAREPDRWKDAGRTHDSDRDPGHFLDLDDEGKVLGGPALAALPLTRAEYETALRAAGTDSWKAGYLSYSIVDGWQQLAKD
ncbi:MAG TPA: S1/P1 Nuclease, partial [Caulobacteraceae bacterium]|nr:S1/P1 Nuclease [Caulobacteraceae bacterium]